MLESNNISESLLINSIGHSVGLLLFAGFLILVFQDRRRYGNGACTLPAITATLALLWNAGSLIVLANASGLLPAQDLVAALSFSVLSMIPAILLQLAMDGEGRGIYLTGYSISLAAVGLHLSELVTPDPRFHQVALWIIVLGFGLLALIAMRKARRVLTPGRRQAGRRIVASMCLFIFAISFLHFSPGHARYAWSSEIALHHAGIPLALYVLLQDYRFLLLDAFLRFMANAVVAFGFIVLSLGLNAKFQLLHNAENNPFLQGVLSTTACVVLIGAVSVRGRLQLLLTRVVFRRPDREPAIREISDQGIRSTSEGDLLQQATLSIARFAGVARCEILAVNSRNDQDLPNEPTLTEPGSENGLYSYQSWMEVCLPLRFTKGDGAIMFLGRREGGRRYLSEDLQELGWLGAVIVEQVERLRNSELQRLVSQAELRALQSQINPHFLFNSLNTLYGTIPREAADARRMVLNLSEIFRYSLQQDRSLIPLSEELHLIEAYLQIESLRLGARLKTEIHVDDAARQSLIPILSIQPLIENAVKHGIAVRSGPGTVRLRARLQKENVLIEVTDDGAGFQADSLRSKSPAGSGVGLENVRQRLRLCFGESARLNVESSQLGSTISFMIPASRPQSGISKGIPASLTTTQPQPITAYS